MLKWGRKFCSNYSEPLIPDPGDLAPSSDLQGHQTCTHTHTHVYPHTQCTCIHAGKTLTQYNWTNKYKKKGKKEENEGGGKEGRREKRKGGREELKCDSPGEAYTHTWAHLTLDLFLVILVLRICIVNICLSTSCQLCFMLPYSEIHLGHEPQFWFRKEWTSIRENGGFCRDGVWILLFFCCCESAPWQKTGKKGLIFLHSSRFTVHHSREVRVAESSDIHCQEQRKTNACLPTLSPRSALLV